MGHLTIKGYPVVVDEGLSNFSCGIIDGAFGFDLVSKGISFKFDTRDSLLIMTSRKGFFAKEEKGHAKVPYKVYGNVPFLWTKIPFARPRNRSELVETKAYGEFRNELLSLFYGDIADRIGGSEVVL